MLASIRPSISSFVINWARESCGALLARGTVVTTPCRRKLVCGGDSQSGGACEEGKGGSWASHLGGTTSSCDSAGRQALMIPVWPAPPSIFYNKRGMNCFSWKNCVRRASTTSGDEVLQKVSHAVSLCFQAGRSQQLKQCCQQRIVERELPSASIFRSSPNHDPHRGPARTQCYRGVQPACCERLRH